MNHCSRSMVVALIAGFIAFGCASPEVGEDDEPVAEKPDEDDEPVEEKAEAVDRDESADDSEESEEVDDNGIVGTVAVAEVMTGQEEPIGEVTFTQTPEGVVVEGRLEYQELGPTNHGFHVHEYGECDPPDFQAAGGHFNPQGHPHGGPDDPPEQRHTGDLGNIEFDDDGIADFEFVDDVIALGAGIDDIAGKALVVHYNEDDFKTQPTGDAGPRAGCGIIEIEDDSTK